MPSPSLSVWSSGISMQTSHRSPTPSTSESAWSGFGVSMQLSISSGIPSLSISGSDKLGKVSVISQLPIVKDARLSSIIAWEASAAIRVEKYRTILSSIVVVGSNGSEVIPILLLLSPSESVRPTKSINWFILSIYIGKVLENNPEGRPAETWSVSISAVVAYQKPSREPPSLISFRTSLYDKFVVKVKSNQYKPVSVS